MTAEAPVLEHLDADIALDRWLVDQHEFEIPCDVDPEHEAAEWIRMSRTCTCAVLFCEPCRSHYFQKAPTAHWPRICKFCGAPVPSADVIYFVPLKEAPVS